MGDPKYDRWEFYPVLICEPVFFRFADGGVMNAQCGPWVAAFGGGCGVYGKISFFYVVAFAGKDRI